MNQATNNFIKDLDTVCKRHKIRVSPMEIPEGIDWIFSNNDIWITSDTVAEQLEQNIPESDGDFFSKLTLEEVMDNLSENMPLYKDSGLWMVYSDDMGEVLFQQTCAESFLQFMQRVCRSKNQYELC